MADTKQISGGRDPIRWTITTTNVELPDALLKSIEDWCRLQRQRNREVDSMCNESDDQISAQDLEHEAARVSQGTAPTTPRNLQQEIANNTCRSINALYDGQAVEGTGEGAGEALEMAQKDALIIEEHTNGFAVVYRRDRTVLISTLPTKRDAELLMATIDAAIKYELAFSAKVSYVQASASREPVVNPEGDAAYWRARAETAELKVLTFHEEIAKLRPAVPVGETKETK